MSAIRPTVLPDWATGSVYPGSTDPDTGGAAAWSGTAVRSAPSGGKVLTGWVPKANAAAEEDNSIVGTHGDWIKYLDLVRGQGLFGGGTDGTYALDGVATPSWATRSGSVYTLTRDVFFVNLTLSASVMLITANFRVFGTGTLTVPATAKVHCNGGAGVVNVAGAAFPSGTVLGGGSGGAGGFNAGSANGAAGTGTANSVGGPGGAGKPGTGTRNGAGGAFGSASPPAVTLGGPSSFTSLQSGILIGLFSGAAATTALSGGGGGGGGGYSDDGSGINASCGGGGGAGGGMISVWFANIVLGGSISADGGAGGGAGQVLGAGNAASGGSGGGGGRCVVGFALLTGTGTITANAGAGGTNSLFANTGNTGAPGTVILCDLSAAP